MSRRRILRGIERELAGTAPDLEDLFCSFAQLTGGQEAPRTEKIKVRPLCWIVRQKSRSRDRQEVRTASPGIEPFIGRWPLWWR